VANEKKVENKEKAATEEKKEIKPMIPMVKFAKKMYIGPSMKGMFSGTIYEDIDSEPLKSLREEYPEISTLLVDVDENVSKKKMSTKIKGNIYNAKYEELVKKLSKPKKGGNQ